MIGYVLAIDPGDRHVGWASWVQGHGARAGEWDAGKALPVTELALRSWRREQPRLEARLVVENFVLYPGQDKRTTWNPMRTSEMIGALKYIARDLAVPVVMQGADIKKPTRAQLPARGIKQTGRGTHARDAELHLWHYLLKEGVVATANGGTAVS